MKMIFIKLQHPPHLPTLWENIYNTRTADMNCMTTHQARSAYLQRHRSWKALKGWLSSISFKKCWYCEASNPRASFDVDHFRPKLNITVDGVALVGDSGYYWLAYEWWNFRISCQRCNRSETDPILGVSGKSNEFPLKDEAQRCLTFYGQLFNEEPKLLDPCVENDCLLLAHGINGEVTPSAPAGSWEFERALYTISQLGFNSFDVPETKRKAWRLLDTLIRVAGNIPEVKGLILEKISNKAEYSAFFRAAVGTHRDKNWVDELL